MFRAIIRVLVALLMFISPSLPGMMDLPVPPSGQSLDLDSRFDLFWQDEFENGRLNGG